MRFTLSHLPIHFFPIADNHLFPFLLAVEKMMNKGIVTREEWQIFTRMSIEAQVDSSASNIDSSAANTDQYGYDNVQKPPWVSDQAWDCIDELEVLPVFSGLKQSVAKHSEQWREYFNVSSFDCNWTFTFTWWKHRVVHFHNCHCIVQ